MTVANPWYNLTAVNASGVLPMAQSVNQLYLDYMLGNLILLIIFFVSFFAFMYFNNNPKLNMMFASFIIAVLSVFLFTLGLVPPFTPFFCWGLFAVAIVVVQFYK